MKKRAFTMAEAVLVMTILGVIATIMITTLKPADFSPADRAKIQTEMKAVYDAAKSCPEAHAFVDNLIERIYAQ